MKLLQLLIFNLKNFKLHETIIYSFFWNSHHASFYDEGSMENVDKSIQTLRVISTF